MHRLLILIAISVLAALLTACSSSNKEDSDRTFVRLERGDSEFAAFPSEFDEFAIYWVGEEFAGHQLRSITRVVSPPQAHLPGEDEVLLIYGTCVIEPGPDGRIDGGCPPPIQIINQARCMVPPEMIGNGSRPSGMGSIRGGAESIEAAGEVRFWTSDVTVKVYAPGLIDATIEALSSPNGLGVGAGEDMPPPVDDCPPYHTPDVSRFND